MDYASVNEANGSTPSTSQMLSGDSEIFGDKVSEYEIPLTRHIGNIDPIARVYRGDETCLFDRELPAELTERHMDKLNATLRDAHDTSFGLWDAIMGALTFQLWEYLVGTHYTRDLKLLEQEVFLPRGLHVVHPQSVAFMYLELREIQT